MFFNIVSFSVLAFRHGVVVNDYHRESCTVIIIIVVIVTKGVSHFFFFKFMLVRQIT